MDEDMNDLLISETPQVFLMLFSKAICNPLSFENTKETLLPLLSSNSDL